jgi:predicted TIM-barrel fold metal-dependent hydrolase
LIPLFLEYPDARFVLFHGGYPWIYEFAAIGKEFPNVWLDLCWLWIISPKAGRELLHLLIETIPVNKICAFGGDYKFIEGTYGHSVLMRQAVSRVLDEKIQEKWFTESEAMRYANRILYLNASELYSL